jgi:hypothetical protein
MEKGDSAHLLGLGMGLLLMKQQAFFKLFSEAALSQEKLSKHLTVNNI